MLIDAIISQTRCRRFIVNDGITTPVFAIDTFQGVFEGLSIDGRAAKKSLPVFGDVFSISKNLDEYQYKICTFVASLADSPIKISLQKYRIAIAAAFATLVYQIRQNQKDLEKWTGHARALMVEVSDAYIAATTGSSSLQEPRIVEVLAYFGVRESDVDRVLASAYGR